MRDLVADWLEAAATGAQGDQFRGLDGSAFPPRRADRPDMYMPGPCGADAIATLKKKHPGTALIAVSGHFNSGQGLSAEAALAAGADRALAKPMKRADFMQAVAELLR